MGNDTLERRIRKVQLKRLRMPFDVTVRAYIRGAMALNPEYLPDEEYVCKLLTDNGIDPDGSMVDAVYAASQLDERTCDNILHELLVEPFL